jgi:hypothetical protein
MLRAANMIAEIAEVASSSICTESDEPPTKRVDSDVRFIYNAEETGGCCVAARI